jgi:hypothetical protein
MPVMSTLRLLDLIIVAVLLLVSYRLVPSAWNSWQIYSGIKGRRLEDASSFAPPPPPAVQAVAILLQPYGFIRIGERSTVLPGNQRRYEWNFVDEPTTTYVSVVPIRTAALAALVGFYSCYADGSFIVTTYPRAEAVRRPNFDAAPGGATIEQTIALHKQRAREWSQSHGQPLENRTMADLLVRDDTYRRLHGGATLRTRVYKNLAITAVVVIATAAELLRVVVIDR